MSSSGETRPLIIKRRKVSGGDGHHGGAWKVAYADFVTAMMAFFLLMWLLNATTEDQRKGIADYFNPNLPISRVSAGGAGMLKGRTIFEPKPLSGSAEKGVPPRPRRAPDALPEDVESVMDREPEAEERRDGQEPGAERNAPDGPDGPDAPDAHQDPADRADARSQFEDVERRIRQAMESRDELSRHFLLRMTPEGLVIEIVDADDAPLFPSGSAEAQPILERLLDVLVPVLNMTTNDIAIVGHTDAHPFGSESYSNWELSADRANTARRLMVARGLDEGRIRRVSGKAAVEPLVSDPFSPRNRRISITLLREEPR